MSVRSTEYLKLQRFYFSTSKEHKPKSNKKITLHPQLHTRFLQCCSKSWTITMEQLPWIEEQRGFAHLYLAQIRNVYLCLLWISNSWLSEQKASIPPNNYANIPNKALVPQCVDNPTNFTGVNTNCLNIKGKCCYSMCVLWVIKTRLPV